MLIGIDASRAETKANTGTENYSKEIIQALLELPEAKKHTFRLYSKDNIKWPRLWTQGGLALELMKHPVDVLWVPAHTLPVVRNSKIKTVVTIHGLEYEYLPQYYQFPQKLWLNKSTEYAVKFADKIIAVSEWTKKQLVDRLGADKNKITVIYEGINPAFSNLQPALPAGRFTIYKKEYLRQIRYKYSLPEKYILFVGTIQPRKNLIRLIEAAAGSKGVNLVIAGKLGWMYEEILELGKKRGVKFIGRVADADLAAVYKMASVFVYPSLMEGFGLPILEAMALGIPVITSDRGALPEVAGRAALIINPEKTEDLAKAIKLILENEDLRQVLIEKGFGQVKQFSWGAAAKQTLAILTKW